MSETLVTVKDNNANPAPLGLIGFGMTTILLNIHNAGFFPLDSMIMGMGIFVGGFAQVVAGILEAKKNNTFGTTAFTAYGFFWLSLVAIWVMPALGLAEKASPLSMGFYLLLWGLFTLGMFFGTLKITKVHQIIFGSLTILFFLLAAGDFTGIHMIKIIAGYTGILCGLSACYGSIAQVLNEVYGKTVLPMD
ncbi:MAG: acetate uptake transporter [Spirochaetia bacterium]|jgi:succinate-acetate transporter protein|nr:acetate uptake transporter [Spirochaetia bacterium]